MIANTFRRASTPGDTNTSYIDPSKRPSVSETPLPTSRRSTIANLSLRLTRSKRSHSSSSESQAPPRYVPSDQAHNNANTSTAVSASFSSRSHLKFNPSSSKTLTFRPSSRSASHHLLRSQSFTTMPPPLLVVCCPTFSLQRTSITFKPSSPSLYHARAPTTSSKCSTDTP